MSEDLEVRLLAIEDALAGGAQSTAPPAGEARPENGGSEVATMGTLGTIPAVPDGTPREQYDYAYSLLKKHQWIEGRGALQAFLEKNPDHELADNAAYWLGETYYINKQYKDAAKAFLEGYKNYPKSDKAPDNLLKLGKSLAALNQPDKACTTYAKLLDDYPNSLPRIIKLAKSEQKSLFRRARQPGVDPAGGRLGARKGRSGDGLDRRSRHAPGIGGRGRDRPGNADRGRDRGGGTDP
jgi:tol-pal system protein YbgF